MSHTSTYIVPFRRRREEKTNYKKRLALLRSGIKRLVVRKSNKFVSAQIIEYNREGDKTIAAANSKELKKLGWNHSVKCLPAAYLTGLLCARKAKEKGVEEAILDIGLNTPVHGSKMFAVLKGAIDGGIKIKCSEEVFPAEERIKGRHIKGEPEADLEKVKQAIVKGCEKK